MSFSKVVILQLVVLAVILESDCGRKRIGWFRIARPVVAAVLIVPFFLTSLPTSGHNPALEALGALAGAVLGLFSVSPALVAVDADCAFRGRLARLRKKPGTLAVVSAAGIGYASLWILVSVARIIFAYTSEHTFPHALGRFLVRHQLGADGLTDALLFLALGMDLFRSIGLLARRRRALHRNLGAQAAPVG